MPRISKILVLATTLATLGTASDAEAYSTRVHIAIANQIRDALVSSGNGEIELRFSGSTVVLPMLDAQAIVDYPLAFRAGAIGPDNIVFPGVTDPSHSATADPYGQCELLYRLAFSQSDRAYALGCFLHGASDAVVHHFVNYLTGETFTLTPLETSRNFGLHNAVRHIVAESMIEEAVFTSDPSLFSADALANDTPRDFVLATYFDTRSPLWQKMSAKAVAEFEAVKQANPDAALQEVLGLAQLPVGEYLVLTPRIVEELHGLRGDLRASIDREIALLQADGELGVSAGNDGVMGTPDDDTDCAAGCPTKSASYYTYVNLIAPRKDASGNTLPSALDKVLDKLDADLDLLLPSYLETIELLSSKLNSEGAATGSLEITSALIDEVMAPLQTWTDRTTTIDFNALKVAVLPAALIELTDGLGIDLTSYIRAIFQPLLDEIRATIRAFVIEQAKQFLEPLAEQLRTEKARIIAENMARLDAVADPNLGGNTVDFFVDSGVWNHSFNLVAATLANHELMLTDEEDELTAGPASFDASYTLAWSQVGLCDNLSQAILPLGPNLAGLLSVQTDKIYAAKPETDSPVECHAGSLSEFGEPSVEACTFIPLDDLITGDVKGSVTRSIPPTLASNPPQCAGVEVPGLPDADDDSSADMVSNGCSAAGGTSGPVALILVLLVLLATWLRERLTWRRATKLAAPMLALALSACVVGEDAEDIGDTEFPGEDVDDISRDLIVSLGDSVWTGTQMRGEVYGERERQFELHFRASDREWVEIRNPFGPARLRTLRNFRLGPGGTLESIVRSPDDWPHHANAGLRESWSMEVVAGDPRALEITDEAGETWTLTEGSTPQPEAGLTATVRTFDTAAGSPFRAFCDNLTFGVDDDESDFNRRLIWSFARGESNDSLLGQDRAAGVSVGTWDGDPYSVTDVEGFRFGDDGGSQMSETGNFTVHYTGFLPHDGGEIGFRERNDSIEDAFWLFLGDEVGSDDPDDLFMEVHNYITQNRTDCGLVTDECFGDEPAGLVPFELVVIRCTEQLEDPMTLQMRLGQAGWTDLESVPFEPTMGADLFPAPY